MKKIWAAVLAALIMLTLFGCTKEAKTYDANKLADALNAGLKFGETLEKSEAEVAYSIYAVDESLCTDAALYLGSGATADEVAVFNCVDETAAEKVKNAVDDRLDYLLDGYSSYGPAEVPKIESAAVITEGVSVILCICENPDAVSGIMDAAAE
ncbi:MAG: DUF4358 domain-containing protein [Clostridia bacterium]|nr:DUF4358 domain-containing protein [Clostridia bacterium]